MATPVKRTVFFKNDSIHCSICKPGGCKHIAAAILAGEDISELHDYIRSDLTLVKSPYNKVRNGTLIQVPVATGAADKFITCPVVISPVRPDVLGTYNVYRYLHSSEIVENFDFIGVLQDGEGLAVISAMLDSWLFARWESFECGARNHTYRAQIKLNADITDAYSLDSPLESPNFMAHLWTLFLSGCCHTCYVNQMNPNFGDDLVPSIT